MKDVKGFCRLFDINVPSFKEIDYYLDQLSKTEKYKNIKDLANLYEENENQFGDLYQIRTEKSKSLIDFLSISDAYTEMTFDLIVDLPTSKEFKPEENKKYFSVDIVQANWQALKRYDHFNKLGNSYPEFLRSFGFPEVLIHSKFLRQFIYGNLNPKRQQKVQRIIIQEIVELVGDRLKLECIKNDEVIFSYENINLVNEVSKEIDSYRFKSKLFSVRLVEDFKIYEYINNRGEFLYKELVGSDGLKFYMRLKKYILDEPLDIRDLYFHVNGEVAIWMTENLKLELS